MLTFCLFTMCANNDPSIIPSSMQRERKRASICREIKIAASRPFRQKVCFSPVSYNFSFLKFMALTIWHYGHMI